MLLEKTVLGLVISQDLREALIQVTGNMGCEGLCCGAIGKAGSSAIHVVTCRHRLELGVYSVVWNFSVTVVNTFCSMDLEYVPPV